MNLWWFWNFLWVAGSYARKNPLDTSIGELYQELNTFRLDPKRYAAVRGWQLSCPRSERNSHEPLEVLSELEESSAFHARTLASNECPQISHDTCPQYCHLFGDSCSFLERVYSYVGPGYCMAQEVLILGKRKPDVILRELVESSGHCDIVDSDQVQFMGGSLVKADKTIFVFSVVSDQCSG
jgi:hypothetical protein